MCIKKITAAIVISAFPSIALCDRAISAEIITSPVGPCPEATEEEASQFQLVSVPEPRIEELGETQFSGIDVRTAAHQAAFFNAIEQAFSQLAAMLPQMQNLMAMPTAITAGQPAIVGVCFTRDGVEGFSFMPSAGVTTFDALPENLTGITLPPGKYAVFTYEGPPSGTGNFRYSIDESFFSSSSLRKRAAPNLEVYTPGSDPSATQVIEEWIPIE